jgi:hypothetical protein
MTAAIPLGRKADGNGLWWPASYYTEATMLAAIGDSTRIVPGPGQLLSPWILQQEKFLDKLDIWGQEFHYLFTNKTMYGDTSPWGELLFSEDREDSRWVARGTNTGAWVDAVLHESWAYTYADDLCMYIDPLPISTSSGGLMQCGGFSNFMATQRYAWANGGSDLPGTTVKDNRSYTTGVTFSVASGNHRAGYLGNGYLSVGAAGRWSGEIIFIGLPLFDTSLIS